MFGGKIFDFMYGCYFYTDLTEMKEETWDGQCEKSINDLLVWSVG